MGAFGAAGVVTDRRLEGLLVDGSFSVGSSSTHDGRIQHRQCCMYCQEGRRSAPCRNSPCGFQLGVEADLLVLKNPRMDIEEVNGPWAQLLDGTFLPTNRGEKDSALTAMMLTSGTL